MIQNIPCRSNPMPYYTTPSLEPDYEKMNFTYEAISDNVSVALPLFTGNDIQSVAWGGSNSPLTSMYYRLNGGSWVDWKALNFSAITLNTGDKLELSGNNGGNFSRSWGNYFNRFDFGGTGQLIMYGNVSSMFASDVTAVDLTNIWLNEHRGTTQLVDASKTLIPYQRNNYSNAFEGMMGFNTNLTGAPLVLNTLFSNCYNYCFNNDSSLACVEVCWANQTSNWSHNQWMNYVTRSGLFICPSGMYVSSKGYSQVPPNFTVLYRNNGYLYYTNGTAYEGTDPY